MEGRDDHAEILRLRNRVHALQKDLMGLTYRVEDLEKLEPAINEVLLAQRVAVGVKRVLDEDSSTRFTRWQKIGIAAAIALGAGDFILQIVQAWP